jgi:hypothetical protein
MDISKQLVRFFLSAITASLSLTAATLTLDPAQSEVTLSGYVANSSWTLKTQGPGSLTTTIGGTIDVAVANGQVQITGGNLDPNVNGSWAPGRDGQAASPADFAGTASAGLLGNITGALRDLLVTLISTAKPLDAQGQFDASTIVFSFPPNSASVLDYDSFITGKGSQPLAGTGTNQTATVGTLIDNNGVQTLTLALDATFFFSLIGDNDTALTLKGQLVARSASTPTESSIGGAQIVNGQFQFTVTGATAASQIEASTDLKTWAVIQTAPAAGPNNTQIYTVPATAPFTFFRVKG